MRILDKRGEFYRIKGDDLQVVEISLDGNRKVIADAGNLFYYRGNIEFEAKATTEKTSGGLLKTLGKMLSRVIAGESLFLTEFRGIGKVVFSSDVLGKVIPIELNNETLIAQRGSFLCGIGDIDISFYILPKVVAGLFGGETNLLQKIYGRGIVFISAFGYNEVVELNNEEIVLETTKAVAWSEGIDYDIKLIRDIKTAIFGGEGLFLTTLKGSGIAILQSTSYWELANQLGITELRSKLEER